MLGQMSIFDFVSVPNNVQEMSEEEIARVVGDRVGLDFKKGGFRGYRVNVGRIEYTIAKSRFTIPPYSDFVSCNYQRMGGDYRGGGSPCESIDKAVEFFRKALVRNEGIK